MSAQKLSIRIGIVGMILLVSWVVYISSKQLARNERIESEVSLLQSEADKIRRENETLSEKIQYFSSPDFREQEAKEKLGMKKENEEVVAIKVRPEAQRAVSSEERKPLGDQTEATHLPNYRKWWQVFFAAS